MKADNVYTSDIYMRNGGGYYNKVIAEICDGLAAMKTYCLVILALIASHSAMEEVTNKVIAEICDGLAAMKTNCLEILALIVSHSR